MRTTKPPSGRRVSDWIGLHVRTRVDLATGAGAAVPAGSIFRVLDARGGLTLQGDPCPHCGVRYFLARIDAAQVEVI